MLSDRPATKWSTETELRYVDIFSLAVWSDTPVLRDISGLLLLADGAKSKSG